MAVATRAPEPVPTHESATAKSPIPNILDEVRAAQTHLRTRLAGAVIKAPADVPEASLPTVPLVDLASSYKSDLASRKTVAAQIREACLTTGFFQISNHGISDPAISGVIDQAKRFFHDLTPAQKDEMHMKQSSLFRGFEPGDASYVNPDDAADAPAETKQGFVSLPHYLPNVRPNNIAELGLRAWSRPYGRRRRLCRTRRPTDIARTW